MSTATDFDTRTRESGHYRSRSSGDNGGRSRSHQSLVGEFQSLVSEAGGIVRDLADLGALRIGMMRAEMRTSTRVAKRSALIIAAAAGLGALALGAFTIALACGIASLLPFPLFVSFACASLLVTVLYGIAAWLLSRAAMKGMKAVRFAPRETLAELRKDFDIVAEMRSNEHSI